MTRDHERATLAFQHVMAIKNGHDRAFQKKYRSICLKLPTLVHTQGLAPALHFLTARGDEGQRAILPQLCEQLQAAGLINRAKDDRTAHLLAQVRAADLARLQALTRETQRVLIWTKRIVQAELRDLDDEPDGGAA